MLEEIRTKIYVLNESLWEGRNKWPKVQAWLDNFIGTVAEREVEQLHAAYLLSNFLYFGNKEIRELLRALYRDLVQYPLLQKVRQSLGGTNDTGEILREFEARLKRTRFFGVGNPSESGAHLLYFFRQENSLPKGLFWETHRIFSRSPAASDPSNRSLRDPDVERYIFIDDLVGSGTQALEYSSELVESIRSLNPEAEVAYYSLFATTHGLGLIRDRSQFTSVDTVFELDTSYKAFDQSSRFLACLPEGLNSDVFHQLSLHYGRKLCPDDPLGFDNGQMLLGFHHNTPDNTLPIIWYDEDGGAHWVPIFRRYPKIYSFSSSL